MIYVSRNHYRARAGRDQIEARQNARLGAAPARSVRSSYARLIGINNRDLKTFEVKLETTERLLPLVPAGVVVVCESGIHNLEQIRRAEALGAHVFLVGEALMRAPDPGAKLRELLEEGSRR